MKSFLGAVLFTLACTLAGVSAAMKLRKRARELSELHRFTELLSFELARFAPPMPELFERLAVAAPGAGGKVAKALCESLPRLGDEEFSALWEQALGTVAGPEREALTALGRVLGRYGAREEIEAAEACASRLALLQAEAEQVARERGKLTVGLAAAMGATASILLL